MFFINSFGIVGGDRRQLYCARSIADDGCSVYLSGFENGNELMGLKNIDIDELVRKSEAIILPLPVTVDKTYINTPMSDKKIRIDNRLLDLFGDKPIFCGMGSRLLSIDSEWGKKRLFDYGEREEFAVANAVPTSEGAIEIAMREYEGTLNGSRCLVAGYGRIGRVLSNMLLGLGANVFAAARQKKDLAYIRAGGMTPVSFNSMSGNYDIIFNTVPSMIFDAHTLAKSAMGAIVIDLASLPGGVDFEAAKRLSIKAIRALSLPGRVAPKAAGIIIKNAVYNIIEEEEL